MMLNAHVAGKSSFCMVIEKVADKQIFIIIIRQRSLTPEYLALPAKF
jgi:hypothetical protein